MSVTTQEETTVRERMLGQTLEQKSSVKPLIDDKWDRLHTFDNKYATAKRGVDIICGVAGTLLLLILYPFIAAGIKLSSRGTVIYKQKRTGQYGVPFMCWKFRTMHTDIDIKNKKSYKPDVTQKNDPRVFWFASLLRRTNLDELPQVINILKGEMSVVGPRPYPISECIYWNNLFPDFYLRYRNKPGLTGLAQVQGYRGGTHDVSHMRTRLDCDLKYVRNFTPWMDIKIITKTFLQMLHLKTNAH